MQLGWRRPVKVVGLGALAYIPCVSRDIFVQDLPAGVHSVQDIPDDWRPQPLAFGPTAVRAAVLELVPEADFSDPCWGHVQLPGVDIEVSVPDATTLTSFALHVRASDREAADLLITQLLDRLGLRALDPSGAETTGIFGNG